MTKLHYKTQSTLKPKQSLEELKAEADAKAEAARKRTEARVALREARSKLRTARVGEVRSHIELTRERLHIPPTISEPAKAVGHAGMSAVRVAGRGVSYAARHIAPESAFVGDTHVLGAAPSTYSPSWHALDHTFGTTSFTHTQAVQVIMNTLNVDANTAAFKVNTLINWGAIQPGQAARSSKQFNESLDKFIFG